MMSLGVMCDDDGYDVVRAGGGGGKGARAGVHDGRDDGGAVQAGLLRASAVPGELSPPSGFSTTAALGD